jgi:AcrR family transcriptional regulator
MKQVENHRVRVAAEKRLAMENKLLMSGLFLASEHSIHDITIDEIVVHAQVSRGTFYKYFASVDVLFQTLAVKIGYELAEVFMTFKPEMPDPAASVSICTRMAIRLVVSYPILARLLLQIQWPSRVPESVILKVVEDDIEQGIRQQRFNNMPLKLGSSLLFGAMLGAIDEMLKQLPATGYEEKVVFHVLLALGIDSAEAQQLSTLPINHRPPIPKDGIIAKILALHP